MDRLLPLDPCIFLRHSGRRNTCSSAVTGFVRPSHPCMTAHTGWFTDPTHFSAWRLATRRTPSLCRGSSPSSLKVPWFLLNHVVEDALLVSSRPSLRLLWFLLSHVVEVALLVSSLLRSLQFFHLLNFVVDVLLVSTLLT